MVVTEAQARRAVRWADLEWALEGEGPKGREEPATRSPRDAVIVGGRRAARGCPSPCRGHRRGEVPDSGSLLAILLVAETVTLSYFVHGRVVVQVTASLRWPMRWVIPDTASISPKAFSHGLMRKSMWRERRRRETCESSCLSRSMIATTVSMIVDCRHALRIFLLL